MGTTNSKRVARFKRKVRIRQRIRGTADKPRLSVFRSAKHISAQVIDDIAGKTLVAASSLEKEVRGQQPSFENKTALATFIGKLIAERAQEKGVRQVVFDRNGFLYHGRVKAVSEGAREAGLKF
ncbi:MAG: 50S ribosomal protein L18 [Desulfosarcinaceae bacterium]|nr:50S ribosomal protein L18 [Desulfosarcinaceae bacterium]